MRAEVAKLYKKYREIINYLIAGVLTTAVSLLLFYGSVWTVLDGKDAVQLQIANIFSWCGAVVFAYFVNRVFVFQSSNPQIFRELLYFSASRGVTLLLDMGVMFFGATVMQYDYRIMKLVSMGLVMAGNYIISKCWVFSKKK